ncbi:two-component system chemotaxis response regulator CheB [Pseudonocardia hierapolitana]|uniref:protein-glutamate methylesterase n=1 Tax=Pseudonocardia hierapolitana TaxID=1128676 RepID=A0A561SJZ6_9PSEU|nr:chemotaxis protein CheB [Pseudonocardia hierapolitana]TWF75173.1 two-component system chemotaxis response regulator CheB [Pseudonocardia hierapolitana]
MGDPVIVMGASAGGVEALRAAVAGLPPDLPAAVVVVLHIPRGAPSALPGILDRAGPLPAVAAEQAAPLRPGVVYVAPADHHVLVIDGHLRLSAGPVENGHRPAIDPLFRSAALAHGPDAVGVVLSGTRDDGTAGLAAIVSRGGIAVVQEPEDALYGAMPANALAQVPGALVHPAVKIGPLLGELARRPAAAPAGAAEGDLLLAETRIAASGGPGTDTLEEAVPSGFSCPSCHGVLYELPGAPVPRFRCRVGHAWSPASLEAEQAQAVDEALWAAVRALEEKAELVERLAGDARRHGRARSAEAFAQRAAFAREQAQQVRDLVGAEGEEQESDGGTAPGG